MALAAGSKARVLAVEPNPRLAQLITTTLDMNGLMSSGVVHTVAAGDHQTMRARLVVPRNRTADASLVRDAVEGDTVVETQSTSVDELTSAWPAVDFVKVDAEGSEPAIWRGMSRTLARNHEITVVLEFKPAAYPDPEGFLDAITAKGFRLRRIQDDGSLRALSAAEALGEGESMLLLRRN